MSACASWVIPPAWQLMIKWNSFSHVHMFSSPWKSVERPLPGHYLADGRSLHHTYWNQWGGTPPLRSWTSTSPSSNTSHTRHLYGKERESYERHAWHIEADVCKAAQDTAPLHPIQDIQHVPIVAHPVVCFNGVITIVNGHLANLDGYVYFRKGIVQKNVYFFHADTFLESECADTSRIDLDLESGNRRKVRPYYWFRFR